MELSKYLKLARQAKAEDNSEDAKNYYNKVREEQPENGEAKYFYAYYSMYEGKVIEVPNRFANLCKSVISSINLIAESELTKEEKIESISEIVDSFVPETWSLNRYMNNKNREKKIGDSYIKIFEPKEIICVSKNGMATIKEVGDKLEKLFISDAECQKLAVIAWKEYVSLSQKWYAFAVKGDAEIYAEKIKKFEPSYEMPKKAGCISLADKK